MICPFASIAVTAEPGGDGAAVAVVSVRAACGGSAVVAVPPLPAACATATPATSASAPIGTTRRTLQSLRVIAIPPWAELHSGRLGKSEARRQTRRGR